MPSRSTMAQAFGAKLRRERLQLAKLAGEVFGAVSQPSQRASSAPVQSEASRAQRRAVLREPSQASAASCSSPRRGSATVSNVPLTGSSACRQAGLLARPDSSARTFSSRRRWRSAPEKRAATNARTSTSARAEPMTRAPSTRTFASSCSTLWRGRVRVVAEAGANADNLVRRNGRRQRRCRR